MSDTPNNCTDLSPFLSMVDDLQEIYRDSQIFNGELLFLKEFTSRLNSFRDFISHYKIFEVVLSDHDNQTIAEVLEKILKIYSLVDNTNRRLIDDKERIQKFLGEIDSLPDLTKLRLVKPTNLLQEELLHFIEYIQKTFNLFPGYDIGDFLSSYGLLYSPQTEELFTDLVQLYNLINVDYSPEHFSQIKKLEQKITSHLDNSSLQRKEDHIRGLKHWEQELLNSINELTQKEQEVKSAITSQSTSKIREVFGTEATEIEQQITGLQKYIFRCFALVITFLFSILLYFIVNPEFRIDRFYIIYLSVFLTLSAFLTYLIRERIRLVKYQHYCKISHNEIAALADYTSQLNDKDKIEDLKIQLAYRYFQGPNSQADESSDSQNMNVVSSKLGEITDSIKDIKSLFDK